MRKMIVAAAVATLMPIAAQAADPAAGQQVYEANCASCHGMGGQAVVPGTPNFATGERLEKADGDLMKTMKAGLNVMPAWDGVLSDAQLANALAYVRTLAN